MSRARCLCGAVTWELAGAFDDARGTKPQDHIFVGSKAPWDEIAGGLPQHREYRPA